MKILVTGGAGFIGTNVALAFAREGHSVVALDNFSRTRANVGLLTKTPNVDLLGGDVRSASVVRQVMEDVDLVVHAAAQAAVTHSLKDPIADAETNILGTLNVLEAAREAETPPHVVYLSTNKVYGPLEGVDAVVSETRPLDFCTPYGCSKGAADTYVSDYRRLFGLPTTVFRMSCIYGGHQYGDTHQGWVAHFMRAALRGEKLTVYGDGEQVRDILHVDDLLRAIRLAHEREAFGVFNLGGGFANAISVNKLLGWIRGKGVRPEVTYEDARLGDQHWYASDTHAFKLETGWTPTIDLLMGLELLWDWCKKESA